MRIQGGLRTMQCDGDVVSPQDFTALSCSWRCTGPGAKSRSLSSGILTWTGFMAVLPVNDLPAIICSDQRDSSGAFLVIDNSCHITLIATIRLSDTVVFFDGV